MNRFLVFAGDFYYPRGGMHDFDSSYDTVDKAVEYCLGLPYGLYDWAHIVDYINADVTDEISLLKCYGSDKRTKSMVEVKDE
jgi:3-hydroxyacyl-CoA dehydrogenase